MIQKSARLGSRLGESLHKSRFWPPVASPYCTTLQLDSMGDNWQLAELGTGLGEAFPALGVSQVCRAGGGFPMGLSLLVSQAPIVNQREQSCLLPASSSGVPGARSRLGGGGVDLLLQFPRELEH